jgi:hypothetical protein
MKKRLEERLVIGTKVKIGPLYAKDHNCQAGEIIILVEGYFEYFNGLYTETQTAPSVWDEERKDFDSIYHMFGNDLEDFMDCEIIE